MPIQTITMDSTKLPVAEQFASWAGHSGDTRLSPLKDGPFLAQGTLWMLGSVYVADVLLDPFASVRDDPLVRSHPADHVQLVCLRDGSVRFESEGIDRICRAPDMFIRDYAKPSRATATRIKATIVYFARGYLEDATGSIMAHGPMQISPEMVVLGSTLRAIVSQLPHAAATSAGFYAQSMRDVLAAAMIRWNNSFAVSSSLNADRTARAKAYIAGQQPGTLSIERLTGQLGISRSNLFRLFRAHGGVMAYDRLCRLRAIYRDLANPTEKRSIAELGAARGFIDKSELTRSFRRAFGCSLQDVRVHAIKRDQALPLPSPASETRAAIKRLT